VKKLGLAERPGLRMRPLRVGCSLREAKCSSGESSQRAAEEQVPIGPIEGRREPKMSAPGVRAPDTQEGRRAPQYACSTALVWLLTNVKTVSPVSEGTDNKGRILQFSCLL